MESLEQLCQRLAAAVPASRPVLLPNAVVPAQSSILVDPAGAVDAARFLRDDPALLLDFCSNVTGLDVPPREDKRVVKESVTAEDGTVTTRDRTETVAVPGCLECLYHLYSTVLRHGPVVLRLRTADRDAGVALPSLTPVWRSCEFQEREVYDLYGIRFSGHPDLRRLLMWEGFAGHPMRKDYVEPDDYEYEPTPHDHVAERALANRQAREGAPKQ